MSDTVRKQPARQVLRLVFGGELESVATNEFKDLDKLDIVGIYPNCASACAAGKAKAQRTGDNAETRFPLPSLPRTRGREGRGRLLDPQSRARQR